MELVLILLTIPAILGVGYGASAVGVLTIPRRRLLNGLAYYIALPALLFTSTADRPISEMFSVRLFVGVVVVMLGTIAIAWVVHRGTSNPGVRSVAIMQSYHTNFGYLGVPLVALIFGELATARAAMILGIGALIQITATVTILTTVIGDGRNVRLVRQIGTNPILIALFLGILTSALSLTPPDIPFHLLQWLGDLALPLALLCTGAALTVTADTFDPRLVSEVILVKIVFMPAFALLVFLGVGADLATVHAGVLMFAMPAAVSTYVFASELGGNREVASINVVATTVASTASLFLVVWILITLT